MSSHLVIWKLYWLPLQVHLLKSLNDGLHLVLPPARLSQIFGESPHVLVEVLRVEVERDDGGEEHGVVGVDQLVTVLDVNAFFLEESRRKYIDEEFLLFLSIGHPIS